LVIKITLNFGSVVAQVTPPQHRKLTFNSPLYLDCDSQPKYGKYWIILVVDFCQLHAKGRFRDELAIKHRNESYGERGAVTHFWAIPKGGICTILCKQNPHKIEHFKWLQYPAIDRCPS
jgi:hypothetical protein